VPICWEGREDNELRVYRTRVIVLGDLESLTYVNLKKGEALCQEEMEQGHPAKSPKQAAVEIQAEVEWMDLLPQDRAETAYVYVVVVKYLTSLDNHVIKEIILSAMR
jgi:hypothetical protein